MILVPTLLCPKSWEGMSGDEATRLCTYCQKHVHNLDALNAGERRALLESSAASVCSRYQAAIRRPAKGKEQAYWRHLLKYGAGVALAGTAAVVLWEMQGPDKSSRYLPGVATDHPMPSDLYVEQKAHLLGEVSMPAGGLVPEKPKPAPESIDGTLDPVQPEPESNTLRP